MQAEDQFVRRIWLKYILHVYMRRTGHGSVILYSYCLNVSNLVTALINEITFKLGKGRYFY